jgi:hypothetical protein
MESIDRKILLTLLARWEEEHLDSAQVHIEAESLWDAEDCWPTYPKQDPRCIAVEVLCNLDLMNAQLIGREDIPAIRAFLETPEGDESSGWDAWESYWSTIDFDARERARGEDAYYRGGQTSPSVSRAQQIVGPERG